MDRDRTPVVVAVDHSPQGLWTARSGAQEAARRHRDLRVVHVESPVRSGWFRGPRAAQDACTLNRRASEDLLRRTADAVADLVPGSRVQTAVRSGDAAEVLVDECATALLLVLGGRSGDRLAGPGATAARVVAHAPCPVLVLPGEDTRAPTPGRSVVVGVSCLPGEEAVLTAGFAEAGARGSDLVAVHSWVEPALPPAYRAIGPLVDWAGVRAEEERLLAETLAGYAGTWADVPVRPTVVEARRAPALRSAAATAELLVVGHRHRGPVAGLGSTTRALLHTAPCPVLVVPLIPTARAGRPSGGPRTAG